MTFVSWHQITDVFFFFPLLHEKSDYLRMLTYGIRINEPNESASEKQSESQRGLSFSCISLYVFFFAGY